MEQIRDDQRDLQRWVLVTGAGSGIGRGITRRCVQDGYRVLALDRDENALRSLQREADDGIRHLVVDLADDGLESRVEETLSEIVEGSADAELHGVLNVAGISRGDSIDGITDEDWEMSMQVNATAPMRLVRCSLPYLERARAASVVNIASPVGIIGARKVSYAASKAALLGLNAALTRNLGADGIRVNAILPGATITGMTDDWPQEKRERIAQGSVLGRLCTPEDVAGVVSFLLSDDASYVTGAVLNVTGGNHIGR